MATRGHGGAPARSRVCARNRREREGDELGEGEEGDGGFQARPAAGISTGGWGQAGRGAEACTPLPSVASSWQEVEDAPALPCGLGQVGLRPWAQGKVCLLFSFI